jgi:hypothetical protein
LAIVVSRVTRLGILYFTTQSVTGLALRGCWYQLIVYDDVAGLLGLMIMKESVGGLHAF